MAGLITYTTGGLSFLLLSALDLLVLFHPSPLIPSLHSLSSFLIPSLFLLYSLLSSLTSPLLPLSLLFLLSSLSSLLLPHSPLPPLLLLSSFLSHFLFLSLSRSDSSSIDSHYFSLLLLPALILTLSSLISISRPKSKPPRIARAAGLALEGTWLLQMGVSLFSSWGMASGCFLKRRSWAEYTVKCKGHMEYHRARAIGTLQFNCHLALMVVAAVGVYGVLNSKAGGGVKGYVALGKEMEMVEESGARLFTLDSDNEEEAVVVAEARNGGGEVH